MKTPDVARRLRFLGSPSVRVDGEDVEPSANFRSAYGLMCRTYRVGSESSEKPAFGMIRAAIRRGKSEQISQEGILTMPSSANQPSVKSRLPE